MGISGKQTMTDGTTLFTRKWEHDDPIATIVLVHGISDHTGRWEHVAEFFVGEGFEVFGYDQRAHGESGDGTLDIEDFDLYVGDVAEMVGAARQPGRPLVIYAHSMGGLIATLHAVSDHEQADAIVLSAPSLSATVPAYLRVASNVMGRLVPKFALTSSVEEAHLSRDPQVGKDYTADPKVYLRGTARFGRLLFDAMDRARAAFHRIKTPTLVIHGAEDELVPPRASAPLAALEVVERRVFPGLRHEMHNEPESDEVLGFVSRWLSQRIL